MNKIKSIVICSTIVLLILFGITFFEYLFLRLLGLQYNSISAIVLFFVLYVFLEIPLSLITNAIPKALKSVGMIQSSKGWLSFILNTSLTFVLIELIDTFMVNIEIALQGSLIFALISGYFNWTLRENDKEPPDIDSKEFREIENKFNSQMKR
ncbi:YrvL family regulatory protein [Sporosarcina sp. NPDC096371]|uniref:YrvL family regulatory protein n=1 Tax=Sporosarcina sp. NPDC096371 TaxID=3364530 RepID=UPI0037F45C44